MGSSYLRIVPPFHKYVRFGVRYMIEILCNPRSYQMLFRPVILDMPFDTSKLLYRINLTGGSIGTLSEYSETISRLSNRAIHS